MSAARSCLSLLGLAGLVLGSALCSRAASGQATVNPNAASEPKPAGRPAPPRVEPQWWNDATFYQVFVRSFQDSAEGPLAGDGIGDIPGIIRRLDYLNDHDPATTDDLGITGLWLMPVHPSPSYHGYDVTDYYDINPQYGTLDDFKALLEGCHQRGIRVIIDHVLNHCSREHPWFQQSVDPGSALHDWFIWRHTTPGWKGPWNQNVWHKAGAGYYYGIFSDHMPDFNYRNPEVTQRLFEVSRFWLEDVGVDGFRLDAIRHLIEDEQVQENTPETREWLRQFLKDVKDANPRALTVGEVWDRSENASAYVPDQIDMVFEFDLAGAMLDAVRKQQAAPLARTLSKVLELYPENQFGSFLSNHDQTRFATLLGGNAEEIKLAASLLLTGPGVPFLYYGEELGITGDKPDEDLRTPMHWDASLSAGFTHAKPWREPKTDFTSRNVQAQSADPGSILSLYRSLIRLRAANPALARGSTTILPTGSAGVYALQRSTTDQTLVVLANLTDREAFGYQLSIPPESIARFAQCVEILHGAPTQDAPAWRVQGAKSIRPIARLAPRTLYVLSPAPPPERPSVPDEPPPRTPR